MSHRKLVLLASASAGLLIAFGSLAMPLSALKTNPQNHLWLVGSHDNDHKQGHRRHDDEHARSASRDCESSGDDDDDDGACATRGGAMMDQNATPPANGLFTPGSSPKASTN